MYMERWRDQIFRSRRILGSLALLLLGTLLLGGCGNGGPTGKETAGTTTDGGTGTSGAITQTIAGTAATGAPLAGAKVTVKDNAGKTASATTGDDGTFSVNVTGMTPPFMLVAIPVSGSNLYSALPAMDMTSTNTQNVNITPVTTLVMYELNGGADPATMYNNLGFSTLTAGAVTAKEAVVRGKLPASTVNPVFSMMYGKFVAQTGGTDPYDALLDSVGKITAVSGAGVTLTPATGTATTYTVTPDVGTGGLVSAATSPAITLKLTNNATPPVAITSMSISTPALLTATVTDRAGAAVPNTIVTFTTDPLFGTFAGGSNTALTDAKGVASVPFTTPSTSSGAASVSASATVAGTAVTTSLSYAIASTTLTLGPITFPGLSAAGLSVHGTTSVTVDVFSLDANGNKVKVSAPIIVGFSSDCANAFVPRATLTSSVTTVNGTATATYLDKDCNRTDVITATLKGGQSVSGNLVVLSTNIGSGSTSPAITLKLTNNATPPVAISSISIGTPALLTATVTDRNGAAAPNAIVTFTADPLFGTFTGGFNTALTDSKGVASVPFTTPSTSGGASSVSASATVAGTAVTTSLNYALGSTTLTLGPITFPGLSAAGLSAYGTTSVIVDVFSLDANGNKAKVSAPLTVGFSSACAASGKATLTSSVTTVNGTATATYLDNGCNNTDGITASLTGGQSANGNLLVLSPNIGSIQFVSVVTNPPVTPPMITLKGTGGAGRTESATVTFRVVDSASKPVGNATVTFDLSTRIGGLGLATDDVTTKPGNVLLGSVTSDPATGNAVTTIFSGTEATAVRVMASTKSASGTLLTTQSDQLLVSTGIPAQDALSLGASTHNIEGGNYDGTTTALTVRAGDHFRNPVPDGTAVSFTSEGGVVLPGCTTVGGTCTSTLTSQAPRPTNGRVTVLARAIGEEAFTDLNGNGTVDPGEMIDANKISTDMPEAFVDYNENGVWDAATEPSFDFNGNGKYDGSGGVAFLKPDAGDGKYEGVLCSATGQSAGGICDTPLLTSGRPQRSIDVRAGQVIVFSTSRANITINGGNPIALTKCDPATGLGAGTPFTVTVVDQNGNAMPAGTTVNLLATNGTVTSATSYTIGDTSACRIGNDPNGQKYECPVGAGSSTFGDIAGTMITDAAYTPPSTAVTNVTSGTGTAAIPGSCKDATGSSGILTVNVTSPKGIVSTNSVAVTD